MAKQTSEPTFPPIPVTRVLTRTAGNVTVTKKLYGPVDATRLERETKELEYRVEQLTPLPPRVRRERPPTDYETLLDEFDSFQSGGARGR